MLTSVIFASTISKTYPQTLKKLMFPTTSIKAMSEKEKCNCVIQPATAEDLQEIVALDYNVTFEFFKPLYLRSYSHLIDPNKVDYLLNIELVRDEQLFRKIVGHEVNDRLHIAYDNNKKKIAGILSFHQEEHNLELDLLLVDKEYRKMGIGRKLVLSVKDVCDGIKSIIVTPLKIDNAPTLKFYESLGFKNLGTIQSDQKNIYGVAYSDMYFYYVWTLSRYMNIASDDSEVLQQSIIRSNRGR